MAALAALSAPSLHESSQSRQGDRGQAHGQQQIWFQDVDRQGRRLAKDESDDNVTPRRQLFSLVFAVSQARVI